MKRMLCTLTCIFCAVQESATLKCLYLLSNYPHKQGAVTYSPRAVRGSHLHKKSCSKAQALLLPARQWLALFYSSPEPCLQQAKNGYGTCFIGQELLAAEASDRSAVRSTIFRDRHQRACEERLRPWPGSCTMPSAVRNVITCMLGVSFVKKCTVGQCHPADRPACARCTSVNSVLSSGPKRSLLLDTATCALISSQDTEPVH